MMLALLTQADSWIALATLSLLEIVLGIDNVIFIALLVTRLPQRRQRSARVVGLSLAMLTRIALLFSILALTRLTRPLLRIAGQDVSVRSLILGAGGVLLIIGSLAEMRQMFRGDESAHRANALSGFFAVVIQIALIDIVFSLDSVFSAVGMARADQVPIMAAAIVISIIVMMWLSGPIAAFIERQPTIKMLALAFLLLIAAALIGAALNIEIPKGYLYCAAAFAVGVELINIRLRRVLDARR